MPSAIRVVTQLKDQDDVTGLLTAGNDGKALVWSNDADAFILADGLSSRASATNAAAPLTTPTYDTSGEAVHPDVYDAGVGNTWNGKRYWMAMTPYPASNSAYENPSILCSTDGTTWTVPAGLTNPIDAKPAGANNSDPDILVDGDDTMWCWYRENDDADTEDRIRLRSSTDGVTWSSEAAVFAVGYLAALSPAVIYDGAQYVMYTINAAVSPNTLQRRTCATPDGTWSAATTCTVIGRPSTRDLWHIDVVKNGAEYHAFVDLCDLDVNGTNGVLYFATSSDGLTWTLDSSPLLAVAVGEWDDDRIYRASGVITATGYDLYYSAMSTADAWRIGRTAVTVLSANTVDAANVTYTPTVLTDWDSDADPGSAADALDQLAERIDDLEAATGGDAADVTYTPTTATDWDSDADPGNVDDALDQLAERVDDLEAAGGGTNVATDPLWDAAGDLVQGTGSNTAGRLAIGTANQLLRVNSGATAVEWASVGRVLISQQTPTGTSVSWTSIPATYNNLYIELVARSDRSGQVVEDLYIYFNNDTTAANYFQGRITSGDTTVGANESDAPLLPGIAAANAPASECGYNKIWIPQYAGTTFNKTAIAIGFKRSATGTLNQMVAGISWESTTAINRVDIVTVNSSNFVSGSTFRLYGEY